jgi:hypothetical protein
MGRPPSMKLALRATALLAVVAAARLSSAAEARPNLKPGQWQTTIKVETSGLAVAIPPMTRETCLTEKDLVPQSQTPPGQECKNSAVKIGGNTVEWKVECKKGEAVTLKGTGTITYAGVAYSGAMDVEVTGARMRYALTGKRLGECKAAK